MSKDPQPPPNQSGRNTAPVELTGDAGGGFEAEVAAYFLAEMLNCATGLGEEPGQLQCIRFQTKDTSSELDDLVWRTRNVNSEGLSICRDWCANSAALHSTTFQITPTTGTDCSRTLTTGCRISELMLGARSRWFGKSRWIALRRSWRRLGESSSSENREPGNRHLPSVWPRSTHGPCGSRPRSLTTRSCRFSNSVWDFDTDCLNCSRLFQRRQRCS